MSDIEERLRRRAPIAGTEAFIYFNHDGPEAADEIIRLKAEVERLTNCQLRSEEYGAAADAEITRLNVLIDELVDGLANAVSALESWNVSPIGGLPKMRATLAKTRDSGSRSQSRDRRARAEGRQNGAAVERQSPNDPTQEPHHA